MSWPLGRGKNRGGRDPPPSKRIHSIAMLIGVPYPASAGRILPAPPTAPRTHPRPPTVTLNASEGSAEGANRRSPPLPGGLGDSVPQVLPPPGTAVPGAVSAGVDRGRPPPVRLPPGWVIPAPRLATRTSPSATDVNPKRERRGSGGANRRSPPPKYCPHPARQCRVPLPRGLIGGGAPYPALARRHLPGAGPTNPLPTVPFRAETRSERAVWRSARVRDPCRSCRLAFRSGP